MWRICPVRSWKAARPARKGRRWPQHIWKNSLVAYGVDVLGAGNTFGVAVGGDTLTSRNVTGLLEGWDKEQNKHYIVIGARMDNLGTDTLTVDGEKRVRIYSGANGNASGMALLLELARRLSYSRTRCAGASCLWALAAPVKPLPAPGIF